MTLMQLISMIDHEETIHITKNGSTVYFGKVRGDIGQECLWSNVKHIGTGFGGLYIEIM